MEGHQNIISSDNFSQNEKVTVSIKEVRLDKKRIIKKKKSRAQSAEAEKEAPLAAISSTNPQAEPKLNQTTAPSR